MFKVQLLYPDAKVPTKAHEDDSGFDLYAHNFKRLYTGPAPEQVLEPINGLIPGCQRDADTIVLNPMDRVLIGCGFKGFVDAPEILQGFGLKVRVDLKIVPRSGLRLKEGLECHFGTIDVSYRGEFGVIITNLGNQAREIHKGDRVAQVIPTLVVMPEISVVQDIDETRRGGSGFGDSGKR